LLGFRADVAHRGDKMRLRIISLYNYCQVCEECLSALCVDEKKSKMFLTWKGEKTNEGPIRKEKARKE
jgi:hypothetical protein